MKAAVPAATESTVTSGPKLNRAQFAVRLLAFLFVGIGLAVGLRMGLKLMFATANRDNWPIQLGFAILIPSCLAAAVAAIFNLHTFFAKAVVPRLSDIGLYGPLRTLMAVLTFVFPLSILLLLLMLFAPADYVPPNTAGKNPSA